MGSPTDRVTVLEESRYSFALAIDSAESPSLIIPDSLDGLRPLHQSMTDRGPSTVLNADFRAVFMSDWSKLIVEDG